MDIYLENFKDHNKYHSGINSLCHHIHTKRNVRDVLYLLQDSSPPSHKIHVRVLYYVMLCKMS